MTARFALVLAVAAACHTPRSAATTTSPPVAAVDGSAGSADDDDDGTGRIPVPPKTIPAGPHIEWTPIEVEDNRIGLAEMSWIERGGWIEDGAKIVWHRKPPGRLARLSMCCWSISPTQPWTFEFLDPLVLDTEIVFQEERQLWVLSRADGHTIFDWSDNRTSLQRASADDPAIADTGTVEIRVEGATCTTPMTQQHFVRACGRYLVYFDDGILGLFQRTPSYSLAKLELVRGGMLGCRSKPVDRTLTIGPATVRIHGTRIVECIH